MTNTSTPPHTMPLTGPAVVAPAAAGSTTYVDWPAIFGGALLASAIAFVLTAFGGALGLSMVSPYRAEGVSGVATAVAVGLWVLWVAITSFMAGGYITGRLRRRINDATEHEVEVRDGAHGLFVWAVATLIGAGMLVLGTYGTSSIAVRGLASAATAAAATARSGPDEGPYALVADRLFVGGDEATKPGGDVARRTVIRVFGENLLAGRKLADPDRAYLAKIVATRTGTDEPAAQARVDEAYKQGEVIAAKAKEAANTARKVGIIGGFLIAASLLLGGAGAWWAAGLGGRHRDSETIHTWLRWR